MIKKIYKFFRFCVAYFRIPSGYYCYKYKEVIWDKDEKNEPTVKTKLCPYWDMIEDLPYQRNGYCHYLGYGDQEINNDENNLFKNIKTGEITSAPDMPFGTGLLWDQCKECGIKERIKDYE